MAWSPNDGNGPRTNRRSKCRLEYPFQLCNPGPRAGTCIDLVNVLSFGVPAPGALQAQRPPPAAGIGVPGAPGPSQLGEPDRSPGLGDAGSLVVPPGTASDADGFAPAFAAVLPVPLDDGLTSSSLAWTPSTEAPSEAAGSVWAGRTAACCPLKVLLLARWHLWKVIKPVLWLLLSSVECMGHCLGAYAWSLSEALGWLSLGVPTIDLVGSVLGLGPFPRPAVFVPLLAGLFLDMGSIDWSVESSSSKESFGGEKAWSLDLLPGGGLCLAFPILPGLPVQVGCGAVDRCKESRILPLDGRRSAVGDVQHNSESLSAPG